MTRDINKLDALPDEAIQAQDKQYLVGDAEVPCCEICPKAPLGGLQHILSLLITPCRSAINLTSSLQKC